MVCSDFSSSMTVMLLYKTKVDSRELGWRFAPKILRARCIWDLLRKAVYVHSPTPSNYFQKFVLACTDLAYVLCNTSA